MSSLAVVIVVARHHGHVWCGEVHVQSIASFRESESVGDWMTEVSCGQSVGTMKQRKRTRERTRGRWMEDMYAMK